MNDEIGSDRRRIEALEAMVRNLVDAVRMLRSEVQQLKGAGPAPAETLTAPPEPPQAVVGRPAPPPAASVASADSASAAAAPPSPPPRRPTARKTVQAAGVEQLVGRYGTIAVATLAILLGLGAFLQWAIARGMLGPEARVALGALAAVVLAALGLRIRRRGSRKFGNALLVIALAVTHLVAWNAGPSLHLVPQWLAFGVAAVASGALAFMALRESEEFLFLLGMGGALLAPFVTMGSSGGSGSLFLFGLLVIGLAIFALRDPDWKIAALAMPFAVVWYQGAGVAATPSPRPVEQLYWPAAFALVLNALAVGIGGWGVRRTLANGLIPLIGVGVLMAGNKAETPLWTGAIYAMLAVLVQHASNRRARATRDGGRMSWWEVVGLPLVMLLVALIPHDRWDSVTGAYLAAAWMAVAAFFWWYDEEEHRSAHASMVLIAAIVFSHALTLENQWGRVGGLVMITAGSVLAWEWLKGRALLVPVITGLGIGTSQLTGLYYNREAFDYTPFFNKVALFGLLMAAAWVMAGRAFGRAIDRAGEKRMDPVAEAIVRSLGPLAVFLWGREELREAFSGDVATFLLVTYYALVGLGTIAYGRAKELSAPRQVGLVLSLYAALKAFISASDIDQIGFRVGSYLVAGAFVLVVAYLYRAKPSDEGESEEPAPPAEGAPQ